MRNGDGGGKKRQGIGRCMNDERGTEEKEEEEEEDGDDNENRMRIARETSGSVLSSSEILLALCLHSGTCCQGNRICVITQI